MIIKKLNPEKIFQENQTIEEISEASLKVYETKAVLGVDIYKYSEYPPAQQMFIPILFESLYNDTIKNCIAKEPFLFQNYSKDEQGFQSKFISTGDGGFQIFDNPFEAIVFSIYFQLHIKRFNSGGDGSYTDNLKKIRLLVGKIELRYAITFDNIYGLGNNFYGPAIINNARVLSKDNLNRLLIDENTLEWFDFNINSVENLSEILKKDFKSIDYFKSYDMTLDTNLFNRNTIKTVDVLKIGTIKIKNTELRIYNLHIQAGLLSGKVDPTKYKYYSMTLGNLNTKGIE